MRLRRHEVKMKVGRELRRGKNEISEEKRRNKRKKKN